MINELTRQDFIKNIFLSGFGCFFDNKLSSESPEEIHDNYSLIRQETEIAYPENIYVFAGYPKSEIEVRMKDDLNIDTESLYMYMSLKLWAKDIELVEKPRLSKPLFIFSKISQMSKDNDRNFKELDKQTDFILNVLKEKGIKEHCKLDILVYEDYKIRTIVTC